MAESDQLQRNPDFYTASMGLAGDVKRRLGSDWLYKWYGVASDSGVTYIKYGYQSPESRPFIQEMPRWFGLFYQKKVHHLPLPSRLILTLHRPPSRLDTGRKTHAQMLEILQFSHGAIDTQLLEIEYATVAGQLDAAAVLDRRVPAASELIALRNCLQDARELPDHYCLGLYGVANIDTSSFASDKIYPYFGFGSKRLY